MARMTLHPDPKALHQWMIATGIVAVLVCGFATLFFLWILPLPTRMAMTVTALTWVGLPLLWAIASIVMTKKWHKTSYILGDTHLTIQKNAFLGGKSQRMYRYDTMTSLHAEQSFWGKRHGYGTLHITISRRDNEVVLPYVPNPDAFAALVKDRITTHRSTMDTVSV